MLTARFVRDRGESHRDSSMLTEMTVLKGVEGEDLAGH